MNKQPHDLRNDEWETDRLDDEEEQAREEEAEQDRPEEGAAVPPVPLTQSLGFGVSTMLLAGVVDLFAHLGPTGLVVGGIAAYVAARHGPQVYEQAREALLLAPPPSPTSRRARETEEGHQQEERRSRRSMLDRAGARFPREDEAPGEDEETRLVPDVAEEHDSPFVSMPASVEVPGVPRLTLEQIIAHTIPNSYEVYIGRSLTGARHPAVKISFYKRHMKLLGASQYGKSSMAAFLIDVITRTHDPRHVQVALLDLEDKTSRLFAHLPHVARIRLGHEIIRLHATSEQQVLLHLDYLSRLVEYRYTRLSEEELSRQPLLIVYLEEFIDLKDSFKHRIDAANEREARERAKADYARLVFCLRHLARRGLKVGVQLLLCAQVDYRDDDLQEALVNVTSGMAFCLRPSAAQAAGFYQSDLLARNARENRVGQAVVEMPDCKDLVLAPQYDLAARLSGLARMERWREQHEPREHQQARSWERSEPLTGTHGNSQAARNGREPLERASESHVPPVPSVPLQEQGVPATREAVRPEEREQILRLARAGVPRREMCLKLGKGKWYYDVVKQVLDEEGL